MNTFLLLIFIITGHSVWKKSFNSEGRSKEKHAEKQIQKYVSMYVIFVIILNLM